jgi:hypothetical protein
MLKLRLLFCTLLIVLLPCIGLTYQVPPMPMPGVTPPMKCPPPGHGQVPNCQPFPGPVCQPGPILLNNPCGGLRVFGKIGPMWLTEKADFPFRNVDPANPQFNFEQMSLAMTDERFWVGFLGFELEPVSNLILYYQIGANVPKDGTITMNATGRALLPAPDNAQNLVSPWVWTAKNVHWWMMEGGLAIMVTPCLGIDFGFRAEHIDYAMTDPRNFAQASDVGIAAGLAPGLGISCARI